MEDEDFDSQFDDDFEDENPVEEPEDDFESNEEFDDDFDQDFDDSDDFEEDSYDDSGDDQEYDKPVSEGDVVEVEIDDLGSKGDGIARVEGFVVFVPGGEVGETYDVEVTSVGSKFAFAEIQE